ncbi:MAG TPA: ECF transporter S component [Roseiflexaceae bacterium]|nr:ECF transporter S component [Roseiflexaceae bacterium]
MNSGRGGLSSTALALIPLAIAINIAVGQLVITTRVLPLYLDSIGTVLVGALLGPWLGMLTGALSNIIWTLTGLPNSGPAIWFSYVAAVIGLIAGFAGRAGLFVRESPRWLSAIFGAIFFFALALFVLMFLGAQYDETSGFTTFPTMSDLVAQQPLVFIAATVVGAALGYFVLQRAGYAGLAGLFTGVVAAILSAPMAAYVFGGVTGSGTDLLVAAFRASGANILAATFAQGAVSDPFDKMTSFLLVWLIIQALPRRLLMRFPTMQRNETEG